VKVALVTYIYPGCIKFISGFIQFLNQLEDEFKLIIFNDNVADADSLFDNLEKPFQIVNLFGKYSINQIRFKSFDILKNMEMEIFIFQDIDDLFSKNRIAVSVEKLKTYDLVCNDLNIIYKDTVVNNFWDERLKNDFEFGFEFIQTKNIVGLGNTAITKKVLNFQTKFSDLPLAYDWFYFFQLIEKSDIKCIYTNECTSEYFQHENNLAGFKKIIDRDRLYHVQKVKRQHFRALIEIGYEFEAELEKNEVIDIENIELSKTSPKHYFWWEEI